MSETRVDQIYLLQEALQHAERVNEVRTTFIKNLWHDVGTSFAGIYGMAQYLWEKESEQHKKTLLQDITHAMKEIMDYCNVVLELTKIELHEVPIISKAFDLKALIKRVMLAEQPACRLKSIKLLLEDEIDQHPFMVVSDDYRLYCILINLVSNAIKWTVQGHVKIRLQIIQYPCASIKISVEDTGLGIPLDTQDIIYQMLHAATEMTSFAERKLGIGMCVIKRFIDDMRGQIHMVSHVGQGTTFTCLLPCDMMTTTVLATTYSAH